MEQEIIMEVQMELQGSTGPEKIPLEKEHLCTSTRGERGSTIYRGY